MRDRYRRINRVTESQRETLKRIQTERLCGREGVGVRSKRQQMLQGKFSN